MLRGIVALIAEGRSNRQIGETFSAALSLHDWSPAEKHTLLARAYFALPQGGALLVYETIVDDDRRQNAFCLLMSLNMLIETRAGADYTRAECASWMRDVGFRETWAEHLLGPDSMVVGIK
jgi:hypothetical protein